MDAAAGFQVVLPVNLLVMTGTTLKLTAVTTCEPHFRSADSDDRVNLEVDLWS